MPTLREEKNITAAAKSDLDALPPTSAQLKAMVSLDMLQVGAKSSPD
jgi:hypothetical protein